MKALYKSDNGYQGRLTNEGLIIVFDEDSNEVARAYNKEKSLAALQQFIDDYPEHIKRLDHQCRKCQNFYSGHCTFYHDEDGACLPVAPYAVACREFIKKGVREYNG